MEKTIEKLNLLYVKGDLIPLKEDKKEKMNFKKFLEEIFSKEEYEELFDNLFIDECKLVYNENEFYIIKECIMENTERWRKTAKDYGIANLNILQLLRDYQRRVIDLFNKYNVPIKKEDITLKIEVVNVMKRNYNIHILVEMWVNDKKFLF